MVLDASLRVASWPAASAAVVEGVTGGLAGSLWEMSGRAGRSPVTLATPSDPAVKPATRASCRLIVVMRCMASPEVVPWRWASSGPVHLRYGYNSRGMSLSLYRV